MCNDRDWIGLDVFQVISWMSTKKVTGGVGGVTMMLKCKINIVMVVKCIIVSGTVSHAMWKLHLGTNFPPNRISVLFQSSSSSSLYLNPIVS